MYRMNMYYMISSVISLFMLLFAYCSKNKEYLIVIAYLLVTLETLIKLIDIENEQSRRENVFWLRN